MKRNLGQALRTKIHVPSSMTRTLRFYTLSVGRFCSQTTAIIIAQALRLWPLPFLAMLLLLAWLSTRYTVDMDWTAGARNQLSPTSIKILDLLQAPVEITSYSAFTPNHAALRTQIWKLMERYQRYSPWVTFHFIDTRDNPSQAKHQHLQAEGELRIVYQGHSEQLTHLSEQSISNALLRLVRPEKPWIIFLSGHGERDPLGKANHDLGHFSKELKRKGLIVRTLTLLEAPAIPDNTGLLVIAGPESDVHPGELVMLQNYLQRGGNLLWLQDPESWHGLQDLANATGWERLAGVVLDVTGQRLGIKQPTMAIVAQYPSHPITRAMNKATVFPQTSGIRVHSDRGWNWQSLLTTSGRSWTETGSLKGHVQFNKEQGEQAGPILIGAAASRPLPTQKQTTARKEQRLVVLGDGDFLSNRYLMHGGNLDLGLALIHWLNYDDRLVQIPARTAPDIRLELSTPARLLIVGGFLILLPLALLIAGAWVGYRRRKW